MSLRSLYIVNNFLHLIGFRPQRARRELALFAFTGRNELILRFSLYDQYRWEVSALKLKLNSGKHRLTVLAITISVGRVS